MKLLRRFWRWLSAADIREDERRRRRIAEALKRPHGQIVELTPRMPAGVAEAFALLGANIDTNTAKVHRARERAAEVVAAYLERVNADLRAGDPMRGAPRQALTATQAAFMEDFARQQTDANSTRALLVDVHGLNREIQHRIANARDHASASSQDWFALIHEHALAIVALDRSRLSEAVLERAVRELLSEVGSTTHSTGGKATVRAWLHAGFFPALTRLQNLIQARENGEQPPPSRAPSGSQGGQTSGCEKGPG